MLFSNGHLSQTTLAECTHRFSGRRKGGRGIRTCRMSTEHQSPAAPNVGSRRMCPAAAKSATRASHATRMARSPSSLASDRLEIPGPSSSTTVFFWQDKLPLVCLCRPLIQLTSAPRHHHQDTKDPVPGLESQACFGQRRQVNEMIAFGPLPFGRQAALKPSWRLNGATEGCLSSDWQSCRSTNWRNYSATGVRQLSIATGAVESSRRVTVRRRRDEK